MEDKTVIKIKCKDGSNRVVKVVGRWTYMMALSLAKDIEGENYLSLLIN